MTVQDGDLAGEEAVEVVETVKAKVGAEAATATFANACT